MGVVQNNLIQFFFSFVSNKRVLARSLTLFCCSKTVTRAVTSTLSNPLMVSSYIRYFSQSEQCFTKTLFCVFSQLEFTLTDLCKALIFEKKKKAAKLCENDKFPMCHSHSMFLFVWKPLKLITLVCVCVLRECLRECTCFFACTLYVCLHVSLISQMKCICNGPEAKSCFTVVFVFTAAHSITGLYSFSHWMYQIRDKTTFTNGSQHLLQPH